MIGTYVSPVRTTITPGAMRSALRACLDARGVTADERALTVLVAMSAHETGSWRSCWNYNLGNVKAGETWAGQYTCLTNVWEVLNGVTRWFSPRGETAGKSGPVIGTPYELPPGHPQTRFRAYVSLESGVDGFVSKMSGMYRPSLDALLKGATSDAFIASLKRQKYFTGDLAKYQASVRAFIADFESEMHSVQDVQMSLILLGYNVGVADGVFGPKTRAAVIAFQKDHNLKPDGVVGPITRDALRVALAEKQKS